MFDLKPFREAPSGFLRKHRRQAVAYNAGIAAILTPPDPLSFIFGTLITIAMYEITIVVLRNKK